MQIAASFGSNNKHKSTLKNEFIATEWSEA